MAGKVEKLMYLNWGKSISSGEGDNLDYHLLVYHCLDVAAVGTTLLENDKLLLEKFKEHIPLDDEQIISLVSFYLAIHDLGKFSERFQNLQPNLLISLRGHDSNRSYTLRHDSMGFYLWRTIWQTVWNENWLCLDKSTFNSLDWNDIILPWIKSVTGHHGNPPKPYMDNGIAVNQNELFTEEDLSMASSYVQKVSSLLLKDAFKGLSGPEGYEYEFEDLETAFKSTSWLLAGIVIVSDWIGSSNEQFEYLSVLFPLEEYWEKYALPSAEKALNNSGILPSVISPSTGMDILFPKIDVPSPMQDHISSCPIADSAQLFILEDTTGSGKTEAALCLAHRIMAKGIANGIYFGLPTMATSNAMYGRLMDSYKKLYVPNSLPSLVLAHGQSHLLHVFSKSIDTEVHESSNYGDASSNDATVSSQCSTWIADNRKKALLADVGVGTIDQALLGVLPSNHQSLRLLGLSRNVLIVDEVHAYDPYMHRLLCSLLEFHASLGGSAILLSATLPVKHRQELASHFCRGLGCSVDAISSDKYPLVTHVCESGLSEIQIEPRVGTERTVNVEFFNDESSVRERLVKCSIEGKCCCWIRNTVDDAIESYDILVSELGSDSVILFHARYAMGDRLKIENDVLSAFGKESDVQKRKGKVLVATQVVEQSLDIDFDYMVTDLAPIDLIFQRAGRLQRHCRDKNGALSDRDERGTPLLGILSPKLGGDISSDWYSDMFPKGAYVYQSHGQLWLTANLLAERGKFCIPDESRYFIECVFGKDAGTKVPSELKVLDERAYGDSMAQTSMANFKSLNFSQGYERSGTQWLDDVVTPTRLGESVNIHLARFENGILVPMVKSDRFSWEMSQLSVSGGRIRYSDDYDKEVNELIQKAQDSMKDKGKWSILIPMFSDDGINWKGTAKDKYNRQVKLVYNSEIGLCLNKE
ncbi:CRISPR-associated helicase Cas3' [Methanohalophilus sp.]|uniref:CRISPR-associated helicase Cas3' n=1 Tax=Methanohalophilus sp. TaxID=1966352 RepID=UPI00262F5C5E|nr:CRISPR-associated helicase Cas3' [Methanohalophilus sp.]MDK2892830.1 CRISPR-associated endonuclease/helicase Cas3 [Methanohalophilus sp.]